MQKTFRKRFFVDPKLQGALLVRTLGYWCFCVLTTGLILLCWDALFGRDGSSQTYFRLDRMWFNYGMVLVAAVVLLPVLLVDVLWTSNRIAGPLYRLRRSLRALANGEPVCPLEFRDSDFWHQVAKEFNALAVRVQALESTSRQQAPLAGSDSNFEVLNRR